MAKTVIVIPTFNEADNIPELFSRLSVSGLSDASVLIVDDNSPDGTADVAEKTACALPVVVSRREGQRGLGAAIAFGMEAALSSGAETIITMDADLSHAPESLPALLAGIESGADLVIGSRRIKGGSTVGWSAARNTISQLASNSGRLMFGLKTHDVTSGLRAYRASFLRSLHLPTMRSRGYLFQVEMVWRAERGGFTVKEAPIHFIDRKRGESKLSLAESVSSFFSLVRLRLSGRTGKALIVFLALAVPAFVLRLILSPAHGSQYDLWAFSFWAQESVDHGFFRFFQGPHDPKLSFPNYALYFPILRLLGTAADSATAIGRTVLKFPSMFMDVVLGALVFGAMLKTGLRRASFAAAFVLYNPVTWYTSAVWGQTDVFHASFLVVSLMLAYRKRFAWAWVMIVCAVFFKLQSIMLIPLIAVMHIRERRPGQMFADASPAAAVSAVIIAPFVLATSFQSVFRSFFSVVGMFRLVTVNVWNPWMILEQCLGRFVLDTETVWGIQYLHIGLLAYGLSVAAVLHWLPKKPRFGTVVAAAALLSYCFFMFPTEMHERYMYPFVPLVSLIFAEGWLATLIASVVSMLMFLNMNLVEPWNRWILEVANWKGGDLWIVLNIACLAALGWWYVRRARVDRLPSP